MRDPMNPSSYPFRSASGGDYVASSSAGLAMELTRDAKRVSSLREANHLKDNVGDFLASRSITAGQAQAVLNAVPLDFAWWREVKWVTFTRRTNDPKLSWLERQLDKAAIPHRRDGHSFHAPIMQVPEENLAEAWAILDLVDDIDDDDPRFLGE